ncbi:MAG: endonuclease III [Verrucomicrobiales bacterium]|nr:endonuclease III [Verrucomicrobiales bacterium]
MPREASRDRADRLNRILAILARTYPNAYCELNYRNPLELLVATILSAQCNDKQVNIVTESLFAKYRTATDYAQASLEALENDIRRIGLYRNKAKNIQSASRQLLERHGGDVPQTMEALTALAGVGRKTANVVLGNAFGINVGVVVDTHVQRLSQRLGFTREKTPEKIELSLMKQVPSDQWTVFSHRLIWHGRRRCMARNPDCAECELAELCPSRKASDPQEA